MPCKNCFGRTPKDTFKTLSPFNYDCRCGYSDAPKGEFELFGSVHKVSDYVQHISRDYSPAYIITLDELLQSFEFIKSPDTTVKDKQYYWMHPPEHVKECILWEDDLIDESDLESMDKSDPDYALHSAIADKNNKCLEVHASNLGFNIYFIDTQFSEKHRMSRNECVTVLGSYVVARLKAGAEPLFDIQDTLVIDTQGYELDTFLHASYIATLFEVNELPSIGWRNVNCVYINDILVSNYKCLINCNKRFSYRTKDNKNVMRFEHKSLPKGQLILSFSDLERVTVCGSELHYEMDGANYVIKYAAQPAQIKALRPSWREMVGMFQNCDIASLKIKKGYEITGVTKINLVVPPIHASDYEFGIDSEIMHIPTTGGVDLWISKQDVDCIWVTKKGTIRLSIVKESMTSDIDFNFYNFRPSDVLWTDFTEGQINEWLMAFPYSEEKQFEGLE